MAILAIAALAGGVISDEVSGSFWERHGLLGGLVSSAIVVLLSVAVINEVIQRRSRQRWRVLAQYVMFELVRNARMIWSGVLDVTGLLRATTGREDLVDIGTPIVRDTPRLTAAVRELLDDSDRRARLHSEIVLLAEHADQLLGRWASVMLNVDLYAEIIDRHVELAGEVVWIAALLDNARPPDDVGRQKRARSSPATQIWTDPGGTWLADRIVVIAQLAEALDRGTLELALQLVPVQWWQARLRTREPADKPEAGGESSSPVPPRASVDY
jgi:hypothetical protein